MDAPADISRRGRAVSLVLSYMTKRTPTVFAVIVIVLMSANLAGTIRTAGLQQQILERGAIRSAPQISRTAWEDALGMRHEITTARNDGEASGATAGRHAEAVHSFSALFPVR